MRRIVACSDPLKINTSYSSQMNILLENLKAEWHYVENGIPYGQTELSPEKNTAIYPGRSFPNHSVGETFKLAKELDPSFLFLYEDPQHLLEYAKAIPRIPYSAVCWFPWDSDTWSITLSNMTHVREESGYIPVCISRATRKLFEDNGHHIDQIYNIADDSCFYPLRNDITEEEKRIVLERFEHEDKKILLYVGRITPRKNPESLFHVAKKLLEKRDDFLLIIKCDMKDPGRPCDPVLEIITRELNNNVVINHVKWDKGIPPIDLNVLYNICDVYISTSGGEGFGLPICEAGLCEKPFVIPNNTTGPEFSQEEKHGLLASNTLYTRVAGRIHRPIVNAGDMANKINYLLENEDVRKKMGRNFRKWVLDNCSTRVVCNQFEKLFDIFNVKEVGINE